VIRDGAYFLALDANISNMVYALVEQLRGPKNNIHVVKNEFRMPCTRVAYVVSEVFTSAILERLGTGSRVAVCSMTRTYTEELSAIVRSQFPKLVVVVINSLRSSMYGMPTDLDDGEGATISGTVDLDAEVSVEMPIPRSDVKSWEKADLLIYSPSISAGVSFEHVSHFDVLYIYAYVSNFTPLVDDLLQMMNRIRSLAKDEVYIHFARRDLSVTSPENIPLCPRNVQEVCNRFNEYDSKFFVRLMNSVVPPIGEDGLYTLKNWRTMLYCYIVMRRIQSNCYFESVLFDKLMEAGYEVWASMSVWFGVASSHTSTDQKRRVGFEAGRGAAQRGGGESRHRASRSQGAEAARRSREAPGRNRRAACDRREKRRRHLYIRHRSRPSGRDAAAYAQLADAHVATGDDGFRRVAEGA
jgi:hypothetical protein